MEITASGGFDRAAAAGQTEGSGALASQKLTPEEQKQVRELQRRDREVRAHEQAHLAAAGPYAKGGASFTYQTGPDGKRYAVGGEVSIDTSAIPGDPEATARKMQVIQRAANAPSEPSGQDRRVASQAAAEASRAQREAMAQRREAGEAGGLIDVSA